MISLDQDVRFSFGKNWNNFLKFLDQDRIIEAENSLKQYLDLETLEGMTFLDIGSGSGLFSLAAYRLGAKVHSFDYDIDSVNCTKYLKEKYCKESEKWVVEQGSILDDEFLKKFKDFDIVYSWGVLHHTGNMYKAFENTSKLVKSKGKLFISIYNDQGSESKVWCWVKKTYNRGAIITKLTLLTLSAFNLWTKALLRKILSFESPVNKWKSYSKNNRGMSVWHDLIDWVGGYPFEVAKPEEVFSFFKKKGFILDKINTVAGLTGCNQFVFNKI